MHAHSEKKSDDCGVGRMAHLSSLALGSPPEGGTQGFAHRMHGTSRTCSYLHIYMHLWLQRGLSELPLPVRGTRLNDPSPLKG
jgi:hypothetical protein